MSTQTFVVTLELPSPFDRYFPRLEAERMADIIREGFEARSVSLMGPVQFTLRVERAAEAASVSGHMREYSPKDFERTEETPRFGQVVRSVFCS